MIPARALDPDHPTVKLWRTAIAVVLAFDVITMVVRTLLESSEHHHWAHGAWADLAGSSPVVCGAGLLALAAVGWFWRRPTRILPIVALLATTGFLMEIFGRVFGVYHETYVHGGAVMMGWLAGLVFARAIGVGGAAGDAAHEQEAERLAAIGAIGALAATYVGAGVSKLADSGLAWVDGSTIRMLILSHTPMDAGTLTARLRGFVVDSPRLATAMAAAGLVVELGAFGLLLGRRGRLVTGTLLLGLHASIFLVSTVFFIEAVVLLLVVSYPWATLAAPATAAPPPDVPEPRVLRGTLAFVLAVSGVLLALRLAPVAYRPHPIEAGHPPRHPAQTHVHDGAADVAAPGAASLVIPQGRDQLLLGLVSPHRVGDTVAEGVVLDGLAIEPTSFSFLLRRGDALVAVTVRLTVEAGQLAATVETRPLAGPPPPEALRAAGAVRALVEPRLTAGFLRAIVVAPSQPGSD